MRYKKRTKSECTDDVTNDKIKKNHNAGEMLTHKTAKQRRMGMI